MKVKSFYTLNNKFNEHLVSLYEDDKQRDVIKQYMKLIKEDKILKEQYSLFNHLDEGLDSVVVEDRMFASEYLNELLTKMLLFPKKEINEANDKLYNFLVEKKIIDKDDEEIDDPDNPESEREGRRDRHLEKMGWYKQDGVGENKLISLIESVIYDKDILKKFEAIKELKVKTETTPINEVRSVEEKIAEFNEKYQGTLTNEEMDIVKSLMTYGEQDKPKVLREYQKNVLEKINKLISEVSDVELKEKYLQLKEQVLFDNETVQLFEIRKLIDEIEIKEDDEKV
jgi:hypothetical protein